ncbi:HEAT repeat domain-containing protein [Gemmata sp. G18]|uniref:HEAT repeat domain-containing protein n=1 Tax=Gemmata palustris TaxID=2822762 RepID=A0ABS5C2H5_9BACT|nr:HEAT repeat domain-containing protein [Gemmata palustris]MBP3959877.1 HEAT repeat domain-containing protein [Gemmata palustris]
MGTSLESLLAELSDPSAEIRRSAILRVPETFASTAVHAAVLSALSDPVWCVREVAAGVAGRFADVDRSVHTTLVALTLRDASPHVRLAAATAIGPRIRPERDYGPAIRHHFERQRIRAAATLGHVAPEFAAEALPLLALSLADAHPKVRLTGLRALLRWEPATALPLLPIIVRKCAEADTDVAGAARDVWLRVLSDPAAELLRSLLPYPGTNDVPGAWAAIASLPAAHALRRAWESLLPAEENQTAHRFAKRLAAVCERVLTELRNPRQSEAP